MDNTFSKNVEEIKSVWGLLFKGISLPTDNQFTMWILNNEYTDVKAAFSRTGRKFLKMEGNMTQDHLERYIGSLLSKTIQNKKENNMQTVDAIERFEIGKVYSTFNPDGTQLEIPYIIDGLLPEGGIASFTSKPKHGKSSLARYAALCVAKGKPFLGRKTKKSEVMLITLDESLQDISNYAGALEYDPSTDAEINLVTIAYSNTQDNIDALRVELKANPAISLVVIDPFMKFCLVDKIDDYSPWLRAFYALKELRKEFPHVGFICTLTAKKTSTEDVFDSMLGSQALRSEFDTNLTIYGSHGDRFITSECRTGRRITPTHLHAEIVNYRGYEVVKEFTLLNSRGIVGKSPKGLLATDLDDQLIEI
jgi:hypothetical protein